MQLSHTFRRLIALLLITGAASAQSTILEDYVREGLESNLALQRESLEIEKSIRQLRQARALFFPSVSLDASYTFSEGGRSIEIPIGDLLNPVYGTLNQLTGSNAFPQIENTRQSFLPDDFHDTHLTAGMPLFNTDIYFSYKARKHLVSVQEARRAVLENELRGEITVAYLRYLQALEGLDVYRESLALLREIVRVNQKLVENDKATPDAVYSAQAELSDVERQLAGTEKDVALGKAYFNFLLNRDLAAEINRDTTLTPSTLPDDEVSALETAALANRAELRQLESALDANRNLERLHRFDALLPDLAVGGQIGYQGNEYRFDASQDFWLVQFSLTWDLFRGFEKQARRQEAQIESRILENRYRELRSRIGIQVTDAYNSYRTAGKALTAAGAALTAARKSFDMVKRRYAENRALLVEYLEARTRFTNARIAQSIAAYDVLIQQAELHKAVAGM